MHKFVLTTWPLPVGIVLMMALGKILVYFIPQPWALLIGMTIGFGSGWPIAYLMRYLDRTYDEVYNERR